jgi:hypothetical protein
MIAFALLSACAVADESDADETDNAAKVACVRGRSIAELTKQRRHPTKGQKAVCNQGGNLYVDEVCTEVATNRKANTCPLPCLKAQDLTASPSADLACEWHDRDSTESVPVGESRKAAIGKGLKIWCTSAGVWSVAPVCPL